MLDLPDTVKPLASFHPSPWRMSALALATALICMVPGSSRAAPDAQVKPKVDAVAKKEAPKAAPDSSDMTGEMFYQLFIAEIQAHSGDPGTAYQIYLELAKRHQNGQLYQRAVNIALQARAGEQALTAAKAWRQALPQSREASEYTVQILLALDRTADLATPLRAMIQLTAAPEQPRVLLSIPRLLARLTDKTAAANVVADATQPWRQAPLEQAEAWIASAESWFLAKDNAQAMQALQRAAALKPDHTMAGLLATDLMATTPEAESIVAAQMKTADASPLVRLAYARRLASLQRLTEAGQQLDQLVQVQPGQASTWLNLGMVRFELKQYDQAEVALLKVLDLNGQTERATGKPASAPVKKAAPANKPQPEPAAGSDDGPDGEAPAEGREQTGPQNELEQSNVLLSQIAEKRNKLDLAIGWLELADPNHVKLNIQSQYARLLARQGKVEQARTVIHAVPETEQQDGVTKLQVEAQFLREADQLAEAQKVLTQGLERFPDEPDLIYDQAMISEKLHQYEQMEVLLRKVIALNPEDPNAYNALGYSLADRNVRLDEARPLLDKAIALRPADPFITDSLAWLAYRSGKAVEAIQLLKQALASKPDAEIAAHLGEILWATGQQEEARQVFKDAQTRDPANDVIKEVLKRLHIKL